MTGFLTPCVCVFVFAADIMKSKSDPDFLKKGMSRKLHGVRSKVRGQSSCHTCANVGHVLLCAVSTVCVMPLLYDF